MSLGLYGSEVNTTPTEQVSSTTAQPQTESLFSAAYAINPSITQSENAAAPTPGESPVTSSYQSTFASLPAQEQAAIAASLPQADLSTLVSALPVADQQILQSAVTSGGSTDPSVLYQGFLQIAGTNPSDLSSAAASVSQTDLASTTQQVLAEIQSSGTSSTSTGTVTGAGAGGSSLDAGSSTGLASGGSTGAGTGLDSSSGTNTGVTTDTGAGGTTLGSGTTDTGTGAGTANNTSSESSNAALKQYASLSPSMQAFVAANLPQSTDLPQFINALPQADYNTLATDLGNSSNITVQDLYQEFSKIAAQNPNDLAQAAAQVNPSDLETVIQMAEKANKSTPASKGDSGSGTAASKTDSTGSSGMFSTSHLVDAGIGAGVLGLGLRAYAKKHPESGVAKMFTFHRKSVDAKPEGEGETTVAGGSAEPTGGAPEFATDAAEKATGADGVVAPALTESTSLGTEGALGAGLEKGSSALIAAGEDSAAALGDAVEVARVADEVPK